jgi:hypothetical protein
MKKNKPGAGRPTDYTPKILLIAKEYVGGGFKEVMKDEIPTVAGLAIALGVSRDTVYDWAKQEAKSEFSDIVADLQAIQERLLLNNGLRGLYNSTIAKLMLSSKHGYAERTEHTGANGTPLIDLTAAVKEIIKRE